MNSNDGNGDANYKKFLKRLEKAKTDLASVIAPLSENEEEFNHLAMELAQSFLNDDNYEYADHLRIARHDRPETMRDYVEVYKHGCCGFYDHLSICTDGLHGPVMFMIGFNHGH